MTVYDTIPPVLLGVPANQTYQCLSEVPRLNTVTATDNCEGVLPIFATIVTNGNCPLTITGTWRAQDRCTNTVVATRTITVYDTVPPVLSGVPANQTFQCLSEVPKLNTVTAMDNCDDVLPVFATIVTNGSCPLTITGTWRAQDRCTNTTVATRTFFVHDTMAPVLLGVPPDQFYHRLSDMPPLPIVTAVDNCDGSIQPNLICVTNGDCPILITCTWRAQDRCNNTVSATTMFNIGGVTRLVTTLADSGDGSLRGAIAIADCGDKIQFLPSVRGVIRLTSGELLLDKSLSISGPGAAQLAISGNHNSRVLRVGGGSRVEISGLTLTEGIASGAGGSGPQTAGSAGEGGGIYNAGDLRLVDCMMTINQARGGRGGDGEFGGDAVNSGAGGSGRGGGIYSDGNLLLRRCTLLGNLAQGGDGGNGGRDRFFNTFGDGGAGGDGAGGGVWIASRFIAQLENCTLAENYARGGNGGGIYLGAPSPTSPGPGGRGFGGAMFGAVALESCTVSGNSAEGGDSFDTTSLGAGTGGGAANNFVNHRASSAHNTILARNRVSGSRDSSAWDVSDTLSSTPWISLGWNLVGITNGSSGWSTSDLLGHTVNPLPPLLGPCQDNGGPVWTMCPLAGSVARDNGNSTLATDARNGARVFDYPNLPNAPNGNGADIGALEVDSLFGALGITKLGNTVQVQLKSDPGNAYRLQQTGALPNVLWTNISTLAGSGGMLSAVDPGATPPRRFYRVQTIPGMSNACSPPASGLVSWWPAEGNVADRKGANAGTLSGVTFAPGKVGQSFNFTAPNQLITIPASASLNVGAGGGFTIEGWVKPIDAVTQMPVAEWNNGGGPGAHLWVSVAFAGFGGPGALYASLNANIPAIVSTGPGVIVAQIWQHVAMTWDAASGISRLYRNGVVVATARSVGETPATSATLYLGARPTGPSFRGQLDELSLYSRALTPSEIYDLYAAAVAGKCPGAL